VLGCFASETFGFSGVRKESPQARTGGAADIAATSARCDACASRGARADCRPVRLAKVDVHPDGRGRAQAVAKTPSCRQVSAGC